MGPFASSPVVCSLALQLHRLEQEGASVVSQGLYGSVLGSRSSLTKSRASALLTEPHTHLAHIVSFSLSLSL